MKFITHILLVLILVGCSSTPRFTNESDSDGSRIKYPTGTTIFSGTASYYADEFHGRKTASGEIYDMNKLNNISSTRGAVSTAEIEQCSKPFEPELGHASGGK